MGWGRTNNLRGDSGDKKEGGAYKNVLQKLALPEYEIIDPPVSNYINIDISKIAIPEISDKAELQKYINKEF